MAVSDRSLEALRRLGAGGSDDRDPTPPTSDAPRGEERGALRMRTLGRCRTCLAEAGQPSGEVLAAEAGKPALMLMRSGEPHAISDWGSWAIGSIARRRQGRVVIRRAVAC